MLLYIVTHLLNPVQTYLSTWVHLPHFVGVNIEKYMCNHHRHVLIPRFPRHINNHLSRCISLLKMVFSFHCHLFLARGYPYKTSTTISSHRNPGLHQAMIDFHTMTCSPTFRHHQIDEELTLSSFANRGEINSHDLTHKGRGHS